MSEQFEHLIGQKFTGGDDEGKIVSVERVSPSRVEAKLDTGATVNVTPHVKSRK
ncbi:MAG TPA: hypothetical protein VNO31_02345 [Umezawaea sp.]|nr:hypothetical protein [Umezawaea sp.]